MSLYAHFLTVPIGAVTLYFTDAGNDFTYLGNTYLAGFLKDIPDIDQTGTIKENSVSFDLHDLDNSIVTLFLTQPYKHKIASLVRATIGTDHTVDSVVSLYKGRMSSFKQMADDGGKVVTISCKDSAAQERQRGRRTNVTSQAQVDPTDLCFRLTPVASVDLAWGKGGATSGGGSSRYVRGNTVGAIP